MKQTLLLHTYPRAAALPADKVGRHVNRRKGERHRQAKRKQALQGGGEIAGRRAPPWLLTPGKRSGWIHPEGNIGKHERQQQHPQCPTARSRGPPPPPIRLPRSSTRA